MSEGTDKLREYAASDREQAEVIKWLIAVGEDNAREDLSAAQAATLEATAEGWETVAEAFDAVDDPDQH